MYEEQENFLENGTILDTVDKKRKELLKLVHTPFIDEREQEESYFNSLSDEEVEKEDSSRATTTVKRPYSHNSEVWRGRLNQLWFDKDPEHAGK